MRYLSALRPSPTCDDRHAREDGRCEEWRRGQRKGRLVLLFFLHPRIVLPIFSPFQPFLKTWQLLFFFCYIYVCKFNVPRVVGIFSEQICYSFTIISIFLFLEFFYVTVIFIPSFYFLVSSVNSSFKN